MISEPSVSGARVILEWNFTPVDYLEENFTEIIDCVEVRFRSGSVEVDMDEAVYGIDPGCQNTWHERVLLYFQAVQMLRHELYTLTGPSLIRVQPDGSRGITVWPQPARAVARTKRPDVVVTEADGTVVSDSKATRIAEYKCLGVKAAQLGKADFLLCELLGYYEKSILYPIDELTHLYDIRDAIANAFGGKIGAGKSLGSGAIKDWDWFGLLANEVPLLEGRHRGRNAGQLRQASLEELARARAFSAGLVIAYVKFSGDES